MCELETGAMYMAGQRHGWGAYILTSTAMDLMFYDMGKPLGFGLRWSAGRSLALRLEDGKVMGRISLEDGDAQALYDLGAPFIPLPHMAAQCISAPLPTKDLPWAKRRQGRP